MGYFSKIEFLNGQYFFESQFLVVSLIKGFNQWRWRGSGLSVMMISIGSLKRWFAFRSRVTCFWLSTLAKS